MLRKVAMLMIILGIFFQTDCKKEAVEELEIVDTVLVVQTGATSVKISWKTNLPGNSVVYYGLTDALGDTVIDEEEREIHTVELTGLIPDTFYYYQVESSSDHFSGRPQSEILQFYTEISVAGDIIQILGEPSIDLLEATTVEISWETNLPGNSIVYYGLSGVLTDTVIDSEERQYHVMTIDNLLPDTMYSFQVESISDYFEGSARSEMSQFTTGKNEESYLDDGWSYFSQADYTNAIDSFNSALQMNSNFAEAYVGRGWAYLRLENLSDALDDLNTGLGLNTALLEGYAGRSLVYLTQQLYTDAITDAQTVISADSTYEFEYDSSINHIMVRLVLAEAYYATQQYELAQEQCDVVDPENGLDPILSETWVVNGATYNTYLEALLALIQYLVGQYL